MKCVLEIRTYRLKAGSSDTFHALVRDVSIPMLIRWRTDVVAFGPCQHEKTSYLQMRAYTDLSALRSEQDAFYGSEEWRHGPREAILSHIDEMLSVVLEVDALAIDAMRGETDTLVSD